MHRPTRPPVRHAGDGENKQPTESAPKIEGELDETDRTPGCRTPRLTPVKASLAPTSRPEPSERIRILIADGKPASRQEFRRLLESQSDFSIVGDVADGVDAVRVAFAEKLVLTAARAASPCRTTCPVHRPRRWSRRWSV